MSEISSDKNRLFRQIVDTLSNRDAKQSFDIPDSVVKVTVERETYPVALPSENTPDDMKVTEYCKSTVLQLEKKRRTKTLPN